jgi:cytochrome c biogenesis protein CcmG/thiol:disulfide interchange protein DsbE
MTDQRPRFDAQNPPDASCPPDASGPPEVSEVPKRRSLSTRLSVAVGLVLLALLAYGFLSASGGGRPRRGEPVPDFTLVLLDGSEISLDDLRGQVVVLNFWASWCSPCQREAPALQRVWETYRDRGVVFVGVTYHDVEGASLAFIQEYGITYANGVDEKGRISRDYGVTAVPETFIIDRDGLLAWFQIGEVQEATLVRQLEELLDGM